MHLLNIFKKKAKPVNNGYVFDKAKYHADSIEQLGLNQEQAFVHTGLFVAWLVNNELMSEFFIKESGAEIEQLQSRKVLPSTIYIYWDGTLISEMLNERGLSFAMDYFDFDKGNYIPDYKATFKVNGDQIFTVEDTWYNYDKLRAVIDAAFKKWAVSK